jgi:O-antigen/teichoic acid export membrane protein
MGPADYGLLGLAASAGTLAGVLTDLGLSHAMVRFGSKYLVEDEPRAMSRFSAALAIRLILTLIVTTVGFLSARYMALELFSKPELLRPLRFMFLTSLGPVLFSFWMFFIQTFQRFFTRSAVTIATALVRVGLITSLFFLFDLTPTSVIVADSLASLLGFAIGMAFSPRGLLSTSRTDLKEASLELIPYCRFTGILIVGDILFNELDTFMLGVMSEAEVVGIYRAAWTYAAVVGFLNQSVANVLFPKVTAINDVSQLRAYIRRMVSLTGGLTLAMLPLLPLVAWWIPFYEAQYQAAVPVFYIMFVGLVVDLLVGPISYVLYSLDRPGILSSIGIFKIVLNFTANLTLIPIYGAHGAALATVLTRVIGGIVTVVIVARGVRESN